MQDDNESKKETNLCLSYQVECFLTNTSIDSFYPLIRCHHVT